MTKHIAHIDIKGYLGIEDLSVDCGKVVKAEGRNRVGKSTFIQAIERAITNKGRRTKQVRDDSDKAILLLGLDDGTKIERTITDSSQQVEVKSKDGFKASKPQTFLDGLAGAFAFNPIDFALEKDREKQKRTLLSIVPVKLTPEDAEKLLGSVPIGINWNLHGLEVQKLLYKVAYDARTQKNADLKAVKSNLEVEKRKIPQGFDPEPYRNVSLRGKYDELREAQAHNESADDYKNGIEGCQRQILVYESSNHKLQYEIQGYEREIEELHRRISETLAKVDTNNEKIAAEKIEIEAYEKELAEFQPIDTSSLESEIESFQEKQGLVVIYDRVQELTKKVAESEAVAKDWGVKVKSIDSLPDQLIKSAKLPVDGLGYDGANFTYAGRPLDNLSDSEMITFSLNIARSLAGDLKVICIDRLEALDDDTRSELDKQMESDDFQYFVTERTKGDLQVRTLF